MTKKYPISPPSSYVAPSAVGFADSAGDLVIVAEAAPLPTTMIRPATPAPIAGITSQSLAAGPYAPLPDAPMHLELTGTWSGTVELQRSVDGGATRTGLTVGGLAWARFETSVNEPVWQESERGATFYLDIALASGTLAYRLSQ